MEKTDTNATTHFWELIHRPIAVTLWLSAGVLFVTAGLLPITSAFSFPGLLSSFFIALGGMLAWGNY